MIETNLRASRTLPFAAKAMCMLSWSILTNADLHIWIYPRMYPHPRHNH